MRPSTLKQRERQLRSFAAALVAKGYDPASLTRVADLLTLPAYKDGLRFFVERKHGA